MIFYPWRGLTGKAMKNQTKQFFSVIALMTFLLSSANIFAEAGKSLFVYGKVDIKTTSGTTSFTKGMSFEAGDSVITGINGRTQLRMNDGAIFDLKPNTEFLIEDYVYTPSEFQGQNVATDDSKGFYKLIRGGFRAISGAIGKKNKKNYKVKTPVATIGIRGTDYTVNFCSANCQNPNGLYVSVLEGGVILNNAAGSLDIDPSQVGYVQNLNVAPVLTDAAVQVNQADDEEEVETTLIERDATDADGNRLAIEEGVEPTVDPVQNIVSARGAYAGNGEAGTLDKWCGNIVRS